MKLYSDSKFGDIDFELKTVDWPIGVGVSVELYKAGDLIGVLKLLCTKSNESYEKLVELDEISLHKKVELALRDKIYDELIQAVLKWQKELKAMGHNNISPIYGGLADAFQKAY